MKKYLRKTLAALLALTMLLSMASVSALAARPMMGGAVAEQPAADVEGKSPAARPASPGTVRPQPEAAQEPEEAAPAQLAAVVDVAAGEASITSDGTTTYYDTLKAAVTAAKSGDTVKLEKNTSVSDTYIAIQKALTLDLNGKTVSGGYIWVYGAAVSVDDSSAEQTGTIINGDTYGLRVSGNNSCLIINGGTIKGLHAIAATTGTVEVKGGTVSGTNGNGIFAQGAAVRVNVSGGTVTGTKSGVFAKNATIDLTGGTVTGQTAVDMQGGTVTVSDNAAVDGAAYGISLQNYTVTDAATAAKLVMTGGTVNARDNGQAITGNNQYSQGTVATISGGSVTGGTGVYWPMGGTLTVSGDARIEGVLSGIEVKQGTVNIEGGDIKATGEYSEYAPSGNGTVGSGWALAVSTQQYGTAVEGVSSDVVVNITGGKLESVQGAGIETINMGLKETNGAINISGNAEVKGAVAAVKTATDSKAAIGEGKEVGVAVSGGTFSSDVSDYLAEGVKQSITGQVVDANADVPGLGDVAKVSQTYEGQANVYYTSLQDALDNAADNATVTMLADDASGAAIWVRYPVVLAMDGKTISNALCLLPADGYESIDVTVQNGRVNGMVQVQNSAVKLENVDVVNSVGYNYGLSLGAKNATGEWWGSAQVTGGSISGKFAGVAINGTAAKTSELTLGGGVEVTGVWYGIAGNGSTDNTNIVINDAKVLQTENSDGQAIYHPQEGTLTINEGADIEGLFGVQMCAGEVTVNGGVITARDAAVRTAPYKADGEKDGSVMDGAALSLVSREGYGDVKATILGGNLRTGNPANAAVVKYGFGKTTDNKWSSLETCPTNAEIAISGGTFDTDVSEYCVDGFKTALDETTGKYVIAAKDYVAQVGEAKYETLQEALDAADEGAEVTLLKDTQTSECIFASKSVTIEGGGHKVNSTASRIVRVNASDVTVTINDIEFVSDVAQRGVQVDVNKTGVVLNINRCIIPATYYAVNICNGVGVTLNIDGCDISGWGALNLWSAYYDVTVKNSKLVGHNDKSYDAEGWNGFGVVVLEGDTTGQTDDHAEGCRVVLENCEIVASTVVNGDGSANIQKAILFNSGSKGNVVEIKGDTTVVSYAQGDLTPLCIDNGTENTLSISGGTFDTDVSDYCVDGFKAVLDETTGKYGIVEKDYVAQVGDKKFETLQAAIDAAAEGTTVELLKSTTESVTVAADKTLTLNIPEGVTLTNEAGNHTIVNNGALTVTGAGTVDNVSHGKAALVNMGTATLNGGVFTRSQEKGASASDNGGNSYYTVDNQGAMTIAGATVSQNGKYSSLIRNLGAANDATKGVLTISSGSMTGGLNNVKNDDYGTLTISGGAFTGAAQESVVNWNVAEITGGTFDNRVWNGVWTDNGSSAGELTISGGTFKSVVNADNYPGGTVAVSGGSFTEKPADDCLAQGCKALPQIEGGYQVQAHGEEDHVWDKGVETKAENCQEKDYTTFTCDLCGDTKKVNGKPGPHIMGAAQRVNEKPATCAAEGSYDLEYHCTECNTLMRAERKQPIEKLPHSYGGTPVWSWTEDHTAATATFTCGQCDVQAEGHTLPETAVVTSEKTRDADCVKPELTTFTATVNVDFGDKTYTDVQEDVQTADANGHAFTQFQSWGDWAAAENGYTRQAVVKCAACDATENQDAAVTGPVVVAATCAAEGSNTYTSTWGEGESAQTDTKVDVIEKLTTHTPGDAVRENEVAATCAAEGSYDQVVYCAVCEEELSREAQSIAKLTTHTPGDAVRENEVAATCAAEGSYDQVVYCTVCQEEVSRAAQTIEKLAHTEVVDAAVAPTCTEAGKTEGKHCSVCNEVLTAQAAVTATGHSLEWAHDDDDHWRKCANCDHTETAQAHTWDEGVASGGVRTYTCTACGAERTQQIGGGSSGGGSYRPAPVTPKPPEEELEDPDVPLAEKPFPFADVAQTDWHYDAVKYVFDNDLMKGTSDTVFSPNMGTDRGMIVTMLYRLEKEPEAAGTLFPDVARGQWYTDAVAWGVSAGLAKGYDNGNFGPEDKVTREQLALFLLRYAQMKGYDVAGRSELDAFADGQSVSGWALDAVRWAVNAGLLKGDSGALRPQDNATRAEAAAMFQRFAAAFATTAEPDQKD